MEKRTNTILLLVLTGLSLALIACSRLEIDNEEITPASPENEEWILKVEAGQRDDALTKALSLNTDGTIKSEWQKNDEVIVYKYLENGVLYLVSSVGTLTADTDGAHTTFSGSLTSVDGLAVGTTLRLTYPSDNPDYRNQDGTLEYISNHCNYSYAEVQITEMNTETKVISTTNASFHNRQAIWKMTFQDDSGKPLTVKSVVIVGENVVQMYGGNVVYQGGLTITPSTSTNEIWVAINSRNKDDNYIVKCVTDDDRNLICVKKGNLQSGKYYTSTLKMEALDANYLTEIKTVADLIQLSNEVGMGKNYSGQTVTLMNDLDMSGIENFTPIGVGSTLPFAGFFDGNHKTISNLTISSTNNNVGLFGYMSNGSGVKDLTLSQCNISTTGSTVGGIAGYSYGNISGCTVNGSVSGKTSVAGIVSFSSGYASNKEPISHCIFSGSVTATNGSAGGIMNTPNHAISNCTNNGVITATKVAGGIASDSGNNITDCTNNGNVTGGYAVGGIDGLSTGSNITRCVNNGNVTANGSANWEYSGGRGSYVGGIVGRFNDEDKNTAIENCINTGAVQGAHNFVGGIAGFCRVTCGWADTNSFSDITVRNCQNSGAVSSAKDDVGGIVGVTMVGSKNSNIIIQNCTNTGAVSGDNNVGGIEGRAAGTTNTYIDSHTEYTKSSFSLTGNVNTGAVTANSNKGGIVGIETDKDRSTFTYTLNFFTQEASVSGAIAGVDQDGAKGAYKVVAGTGVTVGLSTEEDLLYSGTKYYVSGKTITMTLSGGTSYAATDVNSTAVALTDNGGGTFSLTMPAANVTVTAN